MKNYNIFIVASPLQLLNCTEAAMQFNTKNNLLLFLYIHTNDSNFSQMKNILDMFQWDKILYIQFPKSIKDKLFFSNSIKKSVNSLEKYRIKSIFTGEYRSEHITHIVNSLSSEEVYLVDDGLAILNYDTYFTKQSSKIKIRRIIYKIFKYNLKRINFNFFSIFDISQKKIIQNNYTNIKKTIMSKQLKNSDIYFIGQPLVELSMISEEDYKNELSKVIQSYKGRKFVYILHRRQNEKLIKKLAKELRFEYIKFNQLIELEMLHSKIIPSEFATFFSTAILTLPKFIENSSFTAFEIDTTVYNQKNTNLSDLADCYMEFAQNNIKVKKL